MKTTVLDSDLIYCLRKATLEAKGLMSLIFVFSGQKMLLTLLTVGSWYKKRTQGNSEGKEESHLKLGGNDHLKLV